MEAVGIVVEAENACFAEVDSSVKTLHKVSPGRCVVDNGVVAARMKVRWCRVSVDRDW